MAPMRGIDISNWQAGINLASLKVDFAIIKATEGLNFVDKYCDGFVQQAIKSGKLWGVYHFARANDPVKEADYFLKNIKGYIGKGILVLDIEDAAIPNWGAYSDKFTKRVHEVTGIWPLVYTSAAYLPRFQGYDVTNNCGLWLAGYPRGLYSFDNAERKGVPYSLRNTWKQVAIWQFTAQGRISGYAHDLDCNLAYMDKAAWAKYAGQTSLPVDTTDYKRLAYEVFRGKWGSGAERKQKLGDKYDKVQEYVNKIDDVVNRVITGEFGNGSSRFTNLKNAGWDPNEIQYLVNMRLTGGN